MNYVWKGQLEKERRNKYNKMQFIQIYFIEIYNNSKKKKKIHDLKSKEENMTIYAISIEMDIFVLWYQNNRNNCWLNIVLGSSSIPNCRTLKNVAVCIWK